MLVDHDRKFVFVHIPKTAGTSLVRALGYKKRPQNPHQVIADTPKLYADYLRFCFVRNPWGRLYSSYNYAVKMAADGRNVEQNPIRAHLAGNDAGFEPFVMDFLTPKLAKSSAHFRPQLRWIKASSPQFIGRFETMESDLGYLFSALSITDYHMPKVNRSDAPSYLEVYTPAMVDKVARIYEKDIAQLGYSFD